MESFKSTCFKSHLVQIAIFLTAITHVTAAEYKVTCSPKMMTTVVTLPSAKSIAYLEKLKGYPGCAPRVENGKAIFELSLEDIFSCGTTRVYDRESGRRVYYHYIVLEVGKSKKENLLIKCDFMGDKLFPSADSESGLEIRSRRNVLPINFTEAEDIEIVTKIIERAPTPILHIAVRQDNAPVDTNVNVQPGSTLQMIVALDRNSSDTYGLLVDGMKVTDNSPTQEEDIIQDGCSVDPYLFSNFETDTGGDELKANFRAFKFPDSSYVLFIGTVNVCLQLCQGKSCSNGQTGFGRRRRDLPPYAEYKDPNKIFEVTMTTIMRVGFNELENGSDKLAEAQQDIMAASVYSLQDANVESNRIVQTSNSNAVSLPMLNVFVLLMAAMFSQHITLPLNVFSS